MRPAPWTHIEPHRYLGPPGQPYGAFALPHSPTGVTLRVIVSSDGGWEHASVSLPGRTPNWREMDHVCRALWSEDEAVMQLHPPRALWVNNHPHCLHLWRPTTAEIPLPPPIMVGIPGVEFDPTDPQDRRRARAMFAALNQPEPAR